MLATPVILIGIFIAAEAKGLLPLLKKREFEYENCYMGLHSCRSSLDQYEDVFVDPMSIPQHLEEAFLDQVCSSFTAVKTCHADLFADPACDMPYIREQADLEDALADYVCEDNTKRLLLAMRDTPCLNDMVTFFQLNQGIRVCERKLRSVPGYSEDESDEVCVIDSFVKPCLVDLGRRLCGDAFVEFGLDAWENLKTVVLPASDCSSDGSNSIQRIAKKNTWFPF